jgi:glycosyltransferase involved in cell wall biosynthesis
LFTSPYSEFSATAAALSHRADILQLNWVARLIDWRRFFAAVSDCPIFWRLADMSPFTGGCHFSGTCRQFAHRCARCPQMNLEQRCRETALTWEVKERALRAVPDEQLTFVLQSQWMADQLRQSPIAGRFSTVKISNGVDRSVFFSGNVLEERNALGIADDRPLLIVCAGSMTQRKGLSQLLDELEARRNRPEFELLWVGRQPTRIPQGIRFHAFPSPSRNRLREFYSASDLLLFPSLQDNCPNTVIESLASGTPAIVFGGSGTEELIEPGIDGEVVDELDFGVFVDKLFELIADRKLLGNLKDMTVARTPHRRTIREVAVDYVQAYRSRLAAR